MAISLLVISMTSALIPDHFKFIACDLRVLHCRQASKRVICENVHISIFISKRIFLASVFRYLLN